MNDEKFELTISDLAGSGTYYADIADELRARDTAQREALAQLQAEMPDLRANMTKALDLLQVLTSTKYTDRAFVEAVDEADEMLEQLRGKVVLEGLAEQQEARGEQAVDETQEYILRAMGLNYSDRHSWDKLDTAAVIKAADEIARLRAALATRPESGQFPAAAAFVRNMATDYANEHGWDDMGGLSFGAGPQGTAKMEHFLFLEELAEKLRTMTTEGGARHA
ncbi:hypothetical protein [Pseudomonas oryzihabitans]|uniref:hypothetical protein n=1 Tax=Pseudomonas oryzihabitans TaxID=47885 RepID=UPI00289EE540|nr:hypothetical protein [Pseudomonas oryzihabitans]